MPCSRSYSQCEHTTLVSRSFSLTRGSKHTCRHIRADELIIGTQPQLNLSKDELISILKLSTIWKMKFVSISMSSPRHRACIPTPFFATVEDVRNLSFVKSAHQQLDGGGEDPGCESSQGGKVVQRRA